ncbi:MULTISPECIES: hypothetical protein [unclassified Mesorhizobium]|uniref:hypothetical protein n=1 Tax=unclassified Mesorhizobium TaxID=325217 RepID=UPI0015E422C2|nr:MULTISPECIES: hypothetical protein [unclassified Mesorhizobium]
MRLTALLLTLTLLTGCQTVDNCSFWKGKPYDGSQELWRQFDCPLTGQRSTFLKYQE